MTLKKLPYYDAIFSQILRLISWKRCSHVGVVDRTILASLFSIFGVSHRQLTVEVNRFSEVPTNNIIS